MGTAGSREHGRYILRLSELEFKIRHRKQPNLLVNIWGEVFIERITNFGNLKVYILLLSYK